MRPGSGSRLPTSRARASKSTAARRVRAQWSPLGYISDVLVHGSVHGHAAPPKGEEAEALRKNERRPEQELQYV